MNILIADDEKHMIKILKTYFEKEGFKVFTANDGSEALDIIYSEKIDLAVLDWMMPKVSGIEVCKEIKKDTFIKVLMLTAKSENEDELMALNLGADEYVRKPFDPRIVILRAKKLLNEDKLVSISDIKIDFEAKKAYKNGEPLNLTKIEFDLVSVFYFNKGRILSRKKLLDTVWGLDYYGEERTVDTHINRLREKIGDELIKTHRGMGYCMEE